MISKVIPRKTGDNFGRLARYLAAAEDPGEKLEQFWMVNCDAGENLSDIELAISGIEETQALNVRSKSDKTYHMIVSFKNEKPSAEALQDIEQEFAKALGFEEHQRIVATHQNTDNFHMHVAYNKIHPEKLTNHAPKWDFKKREKVCREMERKYGLQIDLGKEEKQQQEQIHESISAKGKNYEAVTWEQSFEGYVKEHKAGLTGLLKQASDWKELHTRFDEYGLQLKKRANGLAIVEKDGKAAMKASALDRRFSKPALEKRFGPFMELDPKANKKSQSKQAYQRKPITKHAKQSAAWTKYLGHIKRKESLTGKAFRNWKDFLAAEALSDPLAMAIIMYHKQLLKGVESLLDGNKTRPAGRKLQPKYIDKKGPEPVKEVATTGRIQKARKKSYELWNNLDSWAVKGETAFLTKNDIGGYGVKAGEKGDLIIPMRDTAGKIHNLQTITDNEAAYIKGGRRKDLFHVIDPKKELVGSESANEKANRTILIAEDYASAATLHEATKKPVVAALRSENLEPVLINLQKRYPDAIFILAPNQKNQVLSTLGVPAIFLPEKASASSFASWNELVKGSGKEAAHKAIRSELKPLIEKNKKRKRRVKVVEHSL